MELHLKYRPKTLKQLIGQKGAVTALEKLIQEDNVPHAILLCGPSGCGKTSIGRILKDILECSDMDYTELNAADSRGIDTIREISQASNLNALGGKCRIWLLDEAAVLAPFAQKALLKLLEDTPRHCYIILATTDPEKLLPTIRTRCTEIRVNSISSADMMELLNWVLGKEKKEVDEEVLAKIVDSCDGSARSALKLLNQVIDLEDSEEQLDAISKQSTHSNAIEIARELMKPKPSWKSVALILKAIGDEPETVRWMVLSYMGKVLLSKGDAKTAKIIDVFSNNFYDSKHAGLYLACWTCCQ